MTPHPMQAAFENIYATNFWTYGSGEGSLAENTRGYVRFLQRFMRRHRVRSVVDVGCGDWQFSRIIDWSGIDYRGFDVVRPVLERNRQLYAAPNISFDPSPADFKDLPAADLLIAKDVLQHWSNATVFRFLEILPRYRLALITNGVNPRPRRFWRGQQPVENGDIEDGGGRRLDLRNPPFNVTAPVAYSFSHPKTWRHRLLLEPERWRKNVLLFRH